MSSNVYYCLAFCLQSHPFLLLFQGDQILKKGGGFFSSMFGTASTTFEDAAERFSRAGLAYKGSRKCKRGEKRGTDPASFIRKHLCTLQCDLSAGSISHHVHDVSFFYMHFPGSEAANAYKKAAETFVSNSPEHQRHYNQRRLEIQSSIDTTLYSSLLLLHRILSHAGKEQVV